MSKTIDQKVVEMRFDNKQFESGVSTTMKSLDKLKSSLKLEDSTKGFDNINKASKNVSFDTISSGVESLEKRFSTLGIVGMRVIENLTDSMMQIGAKLASFLTGGIIQGGINRAMNLENAHFQLQGLLKDEEAVSAVMQNVNDSVDGTAYSLDSAAKVASQFAASGMRAGDEMFHSLRAVAGVAAMTNSEYDDIGRIFTKVAGQGRLMGDDLLSLSSRGMNAAATLATYLGKTEAEVRDMVSKGKLDFNTFAAAMDDAFGEHAKKANETFTGALSNIKAALARIGAEFVSPLVEQNGALVKLFNALRVKINEVKKSIGPLAESFTNTVKSIAANATSYIEKLDLAKPMETFYNILDSIKNVFKGIWSVIKPVKDAFFNIFPPATAQQILNISEKIKEFTSKMKLSEKQANNLKNLFEGVFSVLRVGITIIKNVISFISGIIQRFSGLNNIILTVVGAIGKWIAGVSKSVSEANILKKILDKIISTLDKVINKLKSFVSIIKGKIETKGFQTFLNILNAIWKGIKKVGLAVAKVMGTIGKAIGEAFRNGDIKSLLDIINSGIFTGMLLGIKKWISNIKSLASEGKSFADSIKNILDTVKGCFTEWQKNIKADTLKKIAISIAILAASLWVLSSIDPEKLTTGLFGITILFGELIAVMKAFDKLATNKKGAGKAATLMLGMSVSVLILASAVKKLSSLSLEGLAKGVIAIGVLMAELVGALKLMTLGDNKKTAKGAMQMVIIAAALKILASVCEDLSKLSWEGLAKGIAGIGVLLLEFVGFQKLMQMVKPKKMLSSSIALILIGAAMEIFANVCKKFGQMKWESLAKAGVAIAGITSIAVGFQKLSSYAGKMFKSSISLILIGAAMEIFANVCKKFGQMKWEGLAKAGVAIAGITSIAIGFSLLGNYANSMSKSMISLTIMAIAMEIFANVCKKFGQMEWESLAKAGVAIAGITSIVAGFSLLAGKSSDIMKSSAALLVIAISLGVLTPILKSLGSMSWESIAKGLIAIAGAFTIIGVASVLLKTAIPAILGLSKAMALFGLACLAVGIGVAAFAAAFLALSTITAAGATAIVSALHIIIIGILDLIPSIINELTNAVLALCQVFIKCVPAIGEAIRTLILEIVKILVECIPTLADGLLKMVVGVLDALVEYTPTIVDRIFQFLLAVLEGIAKNLPALIQAIVDVIMALCQGVIDALNSIDPDILVKGILGVGFMSAIMLALSTMGALAPAAMIGVVGFGAVISELSLVLAALGALSEIPGLEKAIGGGGGLLQQVGTAIGKFIGGIAGGVADGVTSSLPSVGKNLSSFMTEIKPFVEGAKSIDPAALDGVKSLVGVITALAGANILDAIGTWLTGESALDKFGEQIASFGPNIKAYADSVKGIDASAVEASVNAAKCLSELAHNLPNSGGVVGFFAGENDIGTFGEQLIPFGKGMKSYSDAIAGFNPEAVIASANAAKAIADMASIIPNEGGVVSWFAGDNSIAKFGTDLVELGRGLKSYSDAIVGFNPEAVIASANAAKALADMTSMIPNEGGVVSWFAGDNSIANFSFDLVELGRGLKSYSDAIVGFNPEAVIASANAAKALADMTSTIPNEGGVVSWFAGDNSISKFGTDLVELGRGLKSYSDTIIGFNPEAVMASANAAKALADMASTIPNEGGLVAWFVGDNSVANFASQLPTLGAGLSAFSSSLAGVDSDAIIAGANAAKAIADMASIIPNEGGVVAWFAGDNSISKFASQLPILGAGLLGFSVSATGINAESVIAASTAAKNLAEMTSIIPNEGGIKAWFSGESGVATFASNLPILGAGLLGFSTMATGINTETVAAASSAAKSLAEMTSIIPNEGGIKAWFSGESGVATFASNLPILGAGLLGFSVSVTGINAEALTAASTAAKNLAEMTTHIPNEGGIKAWFSGESGIAKFASQLPILGAGLLGFSTMVNGINAESVTAASTAAKNLAEMTTHVPNEGGIKAWFSGESGVATFASNLPTLGKALKSFSDSVKNINPDNVTAAAKAAKDLAEMTKTAPSNTSKLISFGDNLKTFSNKLKEYFTSISKIGTNAISVSNKINNAISEVGKNIDAGKVKSASTAIESLTNTLKNCSKIKESSTSGFVNAVKNLGKLTVDNMVKTFNDGNSKMINAGKTLISKFIEGLKQNSTAVGNACRDLVSKASTSIRTNYQNFSKAGKYLGDGLIVGINSKQQAAYNAGYQLGKKAVQGEKDGQKSKSPSKLTIQSGKWLGEGLIIGIEKMGRAVYKSGYGLGKLATDTISSSITKIANAVNTNIDAQPTIRPILDLSDVQSGAKSINGLFGDSSSVDVLSNVGAISVMMNRRNQNGANDDVVSAIDDLRKELGNVGGTSYNINGITYSDDSNIAEAIRTIIRAAIVERRV